MRFVRRLLHTLDNHGIRGLFHKPEAPPPGAAYAPDTAHPFDLAHSVDTSGFHTGEALATGTPADLYNTAYWAISPSTLAQAFARLPFNPTPFTFVDLGCGKGRALLLAAQHGFSQILGVEISPALAEIARTNTAAQTNIEIRTQDAAEVLYPETPLLLFLYHPFLAPLLRRVLQNIVRHHAQSPQELYILFANPTYARVFARFPTLVEQWNESFALSLEDAAADRHGITQERYVLYRAIRNP